MKNLKFIIFFLLLSFLGRALSIERISSVKVPERKDGKHIETKKLAPAVVHVTAKLNRKKRPKKARGIKVVIPNIQLVVFHKFCGYKDITVREVKGSVYLFMFDAQGKRGPPSGLVS